MPDVREVHGGPTSGARGVLFATLLNLAATKIFI